MTHLFLSENLPVLKLRDDRIATTIMYTCKKRRNAKTIENGQMSWEVQMK